MLFIGKLLHGHREAVVVFHLVAVIANEVGRLFDLSQRFELVLADLQSGQGGQLVDAFRDDVGRPVQDLDAFPPRLARPLVRGCLGSGDGVLRVFGGGE